MTIDKKALSELGLYTQFMTEIKDRSVAINRLLDEIRPNKPTIVAGYAQVESAILQVRYICELIALAALAAHSQLGLSGKLLKSWNADETFARLAHLNPNCFPRAVKITRPAGGLHIEMLKGRLDMPELQRIYSNCGTLLHRGVMKHALDTGGGRQYSVDEVVGWMARISSLLRHHIVMLLEPGNVLIVTMNALGAEVDMAIAQADGPSLLIEP